MSWTSDVSENPPKFSIGQMVSFKVKETECKDCPHCGQEYEETISTLTITLAVSRIDSTCWPDRKGSWYATHSYLLSDGLTFINEKELEAA